MEPVLGADEAAAEGEGELAECPLVYPGGMGPVMLFMMAPMKMEVNGGAVM